MSRALAFRSRIQQSALPHVPLILSISRRCGWPTQRQTYSSTTSEAFSADREKLPASLLSSKYNKASGNKKSSSSGPANIRPRAVPTNITKSAKQKSSSQSSVPAMPAHESTQARGAKARRRNAQSRQSEPVGRKRKAEQSSDALVRKRPARQSSNPAMKYDFDRVLASIKLPIIQARNGKEPELVQMPKSFLYNLFYKKIQFDTKTHVIGEMHIQCTVTASPLNASPIIALGEGRNTKQAEKAAFLHMLGKLNEAGKFSDMAPLDTLDAQTKENEKDAKSDIYNYAARYGAVPQFSVEYSRSRIRKAGAVYTVTVEMAEQGIRVSGRGISISNADIAAAIKFKDEAEKFHASQGTSTLIIKDATALNVGNARAFIDFYRMLHPSSTIAVSTESKPLKGATCFIGRLTLDQEPQGNDLLGSSKKQAEDLAYLVGAIHLANQEPSLLPNFQKAPRTASGEMLKPILPINMDIPPRSIELMRETLSSATRAGLPSEREKVESDIETDRSEARSRRRMTPASAELRNTQLSDTFLRYQQNPQLAQLRKARAELPMNHCRAQVLDIVNNNTYSIIIGATGSGKTTQVPQILLEQAISAGDGVHCNIICTQPRRIAATSVARRVADERAESLADSVGYHVRFDAKKPQPGGSILYCTTGILLQQLQHSPDDTLDHASHLVIDEVHERDMNVDFLLIVLKKIVAERKWLGKPVPKVVLMSATMDSDLFAAYFTDRHAPAGQGACPTLSVPGRTFPVKEQHLDTILSTLRSAHSKADLRLMDQDSATNRYLSAERMFARQNPRKADGHDMTGEPEEESIIDWKQEHKVSADGQLTVVTEQEDAIVPLGLVATTIAHIANTTTDGAILVFLPGLEEIVKVEEMLRSGNALGVDFRDTTKFKTYMLHSSIANGQTDVFKPLPVGCRKIILGTNIAETSITIPDVQYVVDTGKLREKQFDQVSRITKLACTWVSKSNSKQRAGRAGRVQNGHYYALFSRERHESLRAIGKPELLRADLQETCLDIKAQAFKTPIREFLAAAIEPPEAIVVDSAVVNLQKLDALTEDEKLTPLGRLLSSLPVHPSLGKMIVLGVVFRCLDPMLILGAAASERTLLVRPLDRRQEADGARTSFVNNTQSDHLALINAFREARRAQGRNGNMGLRDFCDRSFVHAGAFRTIEGTALQIEEILVKAGLIPQTPRSERMDGFGGAALNFNSDKVHIIKALALAGLHPNLAVGTGGPLYRTPGERNALIHSSSINAPTGRGKHITMSLERHAVVSYSTMVHGSDGKSIFLRDTTLCTPLMACLFGGHLSAGANSSRIVEMDHWLPLYIRSGGDAHRRALNTLLDFRHGLDRLLARAFNDLADQKFLAEDPVRQIFAHGLVRLLDLDAGQHTGLRAGPLKGLMGDQWSATTADDTPWTRPMGAYWRRDESSRGRYGDGEGPVPGRTFVDSANMIFDVLKGSKR